MSDCEGSDTIDDTFTDDGSASDAAGPGRKVRVVVRVRPLLPHDGDAQSTLLTLARRGSAEHP